MIPASYLFKNYYRRQWLDAEPERRSATKTPEGRFHGGLMRRIAEAMRQADQTGLSRHA